jgi:hypothetical protein
MPGGDGLSRRALVVRGGVSPQVGKAGGQPILQPGRRLRPADVDGEIEHAGFGGLIAVIARRSQRNRRARTLTRHI